MWATCSAPPVILCLLRACTLYVTGTSTQCPMHEGVCIIIGNVLRFEQNAKYYVEILCKILGFHCTVYTINSPLMVVTGYLATRESHHWAGEVATTLHMFLQRVIHGMACILGCFLVAILLVVRLPGGEVTCYPCGSYMQSNIQPFKQQVSTYLKNYKRCKIVHPLLKKMYFQLQTGTVGN